MTQQEAQKHLECAGKRLEETINQVVQKPYTIARCYEQLQETAKRLDMIRKSMPSDSLGSSLGPPLRAIRAQLSRLEQLLDNAASFYCASLSGRDPHSEIYTPEGALQPTVPVGGLKLEA